MTATIGYSSLLLALALAAWGIVALLLRARTGRETFFTGVRAAILGQFACVTLASLALIYALVTTDFSIKYVALNTTRATPIYYRVTGEITGQKLSGRRRSDEHASANHGIEAACVGHHGAEPGYGLPLRRA